MYVYIEINIYITTILKSKRCFTRLDYQTSFINSHYYSLLRNTNCCLDNIVKAGYIPKHVGSLPDHSPFC